MSAESDPGADWDELAPWWKATFTGGADPEYDLEILPIVRNALAGCRRVLDLGCGEGQVSRAVSAEIGRGAVVVGLDPSAAQLANAWVAGGPPQYVRGKGEQLPFADGTFDGVCCCLVIEHADDVDAVLAEVARVVAVGGRFVLLVNHPLYQGPASGLIDDRILDERYWRVGPYLTESRGPEEVDPGVAVVFAHRPLSRYINPLAAADLVLVEMLEPPPRRELLEGSPAPELEGAIPRLLAMCFERRPRSGARIGWSDAGEAPAGAVQEGGRRWPST
ncbi:MAG: methyltransferase family protein [Acidimicrobiaceae bacterium]|nr:methyltransferase family protein [Acidimicrobiaceae bacterium]